jgi:transposase
MEENLIKTIEIHSKAFKQKVVEEYLSGNGTQRELSRRYGIKSRSTIPRWIKELGYSNMNNEIGRKHKLESISYTYMPSKTVSANEDPKELQKRIAELERQLQDEKLRTEAYQRMIEKTEKDLNISIRKKPFTR